MAEMTEQRFNIVMMKGMRRNVDGVGDKGVGGDKSIFR